MLYLKCLLLFSHSVYKSFHKSNCLQLVASEDLSRISTFLQFLQDDEALGFISDRTLSSQFVKTVNFSLL